MTTTLCRLPLSPLLSRRARFTLVCLVFFATSQGAPAQEEIPNHRPVVTEHDLATACALDLRPLTQFAPAESFEFACSSEGVLNLLRLPFGESSPDEVLAEVFAALHLEGDWEVAGELLDEETQVLETRMIRRQSQGFEVAGAGLTVRSFGGAPFEIEGLIANLEDLLVEVGMYSADDWQSILEAEVEGPWVVSPDLPWEKRLQLADEPLLVYSAEVEGATLWLDSFGEIRHQTETIPAFSFGTLGYLETGCRTATCVTKAVDSVLALKGMPNVQNDLRTRKRYGPVTGRDVVIELLQEYRPWLEGIGESAVDRAEESLRVQGLFDRVFRQRSVPEADREYLANVVHALWVELNLHRAPVSGAPSSLISHPRIGWSLDDFSPLTVQSFLLGDAVLSRSLATGQAAYQFKHYPKAAEAMGRMASIYSQQIHQASLTINRMVEAAADYQVRRYDFPHEPDYTTIINHEESVDLDLSEGFQRRLGNCGLSSQMATMLARAVNLPAISRVPWGTQGGSRVLGEHYHVRFPTLRAWVHGEALASALGARGHKMLRTELVVYSESPSQRYYQSISTRNAALLDLEVNYAVRTFNPYPIVHSPVRARRWQANDSPGNRIGFLLSNPSGAPANYAAARFGVLGAVISGDEIQLPESGWSLLEEVAVHLPLDGDALAARRIENRTLRGLDGTVHGSVLGSLASRRGGALYLSSGAYLELPDQPTIRRNNQELTLSLHYWPKRMAGGTVQSGTLLELQDPAAGSAGPYYQLRVDSQGLLTFEARHRLGLERVRTSFGLTGSGPYHVVATYAQGGSIRLFVNGQRAASVRFPAEVDQGIVWSDGHNTRQARLRLGGNGFEGTLDEFLLFFGELTEPEVVALTASY